MRSTKVIYDEKNSVLRAIKQLSEKAIIEQRGFTEVEDKQAKFLKQRIEELTQEYEAAKAELRNGATVVEERGSSYMKTNKGLEIRTIVDTGAVNDVLPVGISNKVIKKITENSQIITEATLIQYEGDFRVARENSSQEALLLSENEEIPDTELVNRETITLKDVRIGSLIKISKSVLNNAPAIGEDYLINTLSRRVQRTLDKMAFHADDKGNNMTSGILKDGKRIEASNIDIDILIDMVTDMVTDMEEVYLQGAKWYMNRELYQEISKLKFTDGRPALFMDIRSDKPTRVLFGLPVIISEYAEKVCLVNLSMALTFKYADNFGEITILKEKFITEGCYGFMVSAYGDIAVTNPDATRVLEVA